MRRGAKVTTRGQINPSTKVSKLAQKRQVIWVRNGPPRNHYEVLKEHLKTCTKRTKWKVYMILLNRFIIACCCFAIYSLDPLTCFLKTSTIALIFFSSWRRAPKWCPNHKQERKKINKINKINKRSSKLSQQA